MPQSSEKTTVAVTGVSKSYKLANARGLGWFRQDQSSAAVAALHPISLVARSGDSIGLIGQNGSGKSTLLNIIAGNERPSTGEVWVSSLPTLLGVAPALQPHLTGRENVRLGLLALGLEKYEVNDLTPKVLEWCELVEAGGRPMNTYSSGMKARLVFGISTAVPREILLIDEALSTGDSTFSAKAEQRMEEFLADSGTLFLVSHSPETIENFCNRAIWLHDGEVIGDDDPYYLSREYKRWSRHTAANGANSADWAIENRRASYLAPEVILRGTQSTGKHRR
ncbi:ABC transporter ATP-binding protein [Corynebacterium qintianiae]|uniref:ABC transporter ATP-binding protein n=1 Tax=Corynebacterium qintianiae TaxID=2709392 RepID=A0A7T0KMH9_9CORY|nr:ABC transporter ATP-binding protein [Corynebacterium qintianiae]QPK82774.1 ABC transporter ATP-binding protein [Corynebacterium qintianiae]